MEHPVSKWEIQQLKDYIVLLERDIKRLRKDKKILKLYLKEDTLLIDKFRRQGFRYDKDGWGWHYLVFPIKGIPGSLYIKEVKRLIDEAMRPYLEKNGEYDGYKIESINYSERFKNWYVQVGKMIDGDFEEWEHTRRHLSILKSEDKK